MAVFAPIVLPKPLINDKGWAIEFWDYNRFRWTEEYGCFYPLNMTFEFDGGRFLPSPGVNATFVTDEEFRKIIIPSEASLLADIFLANAVPAQGGNNRHILDNIFIFDYADRSPEENHKLIVNGILNPLPGGLAFGPGIPNKNATGLHIFLPRYVNEIIFPQIGFNQNKPGKKVTYDSLLQYACRYLYTEDDIPYYHDCIRALQAEYNYMSINTIKLNNTINVRNKVAYDRRIYNMRNAIGPEDRISSNLNDCERCKKWVVYCAKENDPDWLVNSRIFAKLFHEKDSTNTLYVGVNYPEDEYLDDNNSAIYFKDKKSAYEFFNSLKDKNKWTKDPIGEVCCVQINEYCCQFQGSDPNFNSTCYDSQQECAQLNFCGSGSGSDEEIQSFIYNPSTKTWTVK